MGLEELTTSCDIDIWRPKEVAVDGEGAGRRQNVQVGVPVEEIPRRLDRHDRTGESLSAGVGADDESAKDRKEESLQRPEKLQ